jgi:hypothetical protein
LNRQTILCPSKLAPVRLIVNFFYWIKYSRSQQVFPAIFCGFSLSGHAFSGICRPGYEEVEFGTLRPLAAGPSLKTAQKTTTDSPIRLFSAADRLFELCG